MRVNTIEPGWRLAAGAPGKSAGSSGRSATVTYPVAATNAAYSSFVTAYGLIANAGSATSRTGASSA